MGGKSKKATVGYQYHLGIHMVLCHGPIDTVTRIEVDGRIAWAGRTDGTSPIEFDQDAGNLFGGDKREGGVGGLVDIDMGDPAQGQNTYLLTQLGEDMPSFRGVVSAVLNQCYVGNNPYLKAWSFTAQRIYTRQDGLDQWYSSTAGIFNASSTAGENCQYNCAALIEALSDIDQDGIVNTWHDGDYSSFGWPLASSSGEALSKWRAYSNFISGPSLETDWSETSPGVAPGFTMSDVSTWAYESQLGFCSITHVMNVVQTGSGSEAVLIPSNMVANTDYMFALVIAGAGGSSSITHELVRNNSHYYSYYASGTRTRYVTANVSISPNGAGGLKIVILAGDDPNREITEIDLGDVSGKWLLVTGSMSGGYVHPDESSTNFLSSVYVEVTASDGRTFSGGASGHYHLALHPEITEIANDIYTQPRYLYQTSSANIAVAMMVYIPGIDLDLLEVLSNAFLANFDDFAGGDWCECLDMNPAHIIRECLTDPDWGMGYLDADIDDDSFMDAADALFYEVMGISLLWDRQVPLEDFISEILRHIDGVLYVDRMSGKFVLNLVRDDYALSSLVVLDESNISNVANASRPTIGELTNSITVNYHDANTGETGSVSVQDQALIQIQGATIGTTVQYPGFTNQNIAVRVAQRDLKALSIPLLSADITANREAGLLNVGDPFILSWPDLDVRDVVMRVQSISLGDGRDNSISITAVEDVFSLTEYNDTIIGNPESGLWIDPTSVDPLAASPRVVTEMPYYPLVLDRGQLAVDTLLDDESDAGFLLAAGGRLGGELNANLMVDSGAGYIDSDTLDFSPYAALASDAWYTDTELYITGGVDLESVEVGSIAQIDDELVRVDGFGEDSNGDYVSVGRGVLDTVPQQHVLDSNGAPVIVFLGDFMASDEVQYTASDEVDVKMLSTLGSTILSSSDAPFDRVTMNSRAIRPYPPGDLRVNSVSYPSNAIYSDGMELSWAHRDRTQQTGGSIIDYSGGDIGPEFGTIYSVVGRSLLADGNFTADWYHQDAVADSSGDDSSVALEINSSTGDPPAGTEYIYFRVVARRDGYDAWQAPEVPVSFDGEPIPETDPYFDDNVSLCHYDGVDGSTTITDVMGLSWSAFGNAQLDSAQSKFGGSSLLLDGSGDYLTQGAAADWKFLSDGTVDYTVEFFVRPAVNNITQVILGTDGVASSRVGISIDINPSGYIDVLLGKGTNGSYSARITGSTVIPTASWSHVAVVMYSGTLYVYLDGVLEGSAVPSSPSSSNPDAALQIGRYKGGGSLYYNGHLDELRITNGVARYTSAFTPPADPFPDA